MTVPRISAKKLKALGGKLPWSSITSPRKPRKRSGKPKAKKRSAKEFARIYHSEERVAWVKSRSCEACGFEGDTENAHIAGEGIGRKGGYDKIIPLCSVCHRQQHSIGAGSFAIRWELNLRELAAKTQRAWLASLPPLEASPKC